MTSPRYDRVPDNDQIIINGFLEPSAKPTKYNEQSDIIVYTDISNTETNILSHRLGTLLHLLRGDHRSGPAFANLFERAGVTGNYTMENLDKFEQSLKNKKTTVLLDYWLLRLQGHINRLGDNGDARYLKDEIYEKLVEKLENYELEMGKLNLHPSAHQNNARRDLVEAMQREWREILDKGIEKYKDQWDIRNILLNLVACATVFGLIGLFCKNLYRITQGKELQLFQYEKAHSIKIDKLNKLYADIEAATENDAAERTNYFTKDKAASIETLSKFNRIFGEFKSKLEEDRKKANANRNKASVKTLRTISTLDPLILILHAYILKFSSDLFVGNNENDLEDLSETSDLVVGNNKNDLEDLSEINELFMRSCVNNLKDKNYKAAAESNNLSADTRDLLKQMIEFSKKFEEELEILEKPNNSKTVLGYYSSGSDEGDS